MNADCSRSSRGGQEHGPELGPALALDSSHRVSCGSTIGGSMRRMKQLTVRDFIDLVATVAMLLASSTILWAYYRHPTRTETRLKIPPAPVSVEGAAQLGEPSAPISVVEFLDFDCPSCRNFDQTVFPHIRADYIDTGKVFWTWRHFPLKQIHS